MGIDNALKLGLNWAEERMASELTEMDREYILSGIKAGLETNCSIPDVSELIDMRKKAISVFELTKGFSGEPTDNAMKTALEMADYVMRLTNDLDKYIKY